MCLTGIYQIISVITINVHLSLLGEDPDWHGGGGGNYKHPSPTITKSLLGEDPEWLFLLGEVGGVGINTAPP